jgi:predicted phosphate transport protein (TIGR00153 family)
MFGWFQKLLPKSGDFFALFERHAVTMVAAGEALVKLTAGEGDAAVHVRRIRDEEHAADEVIRQTLHEVRQTFLTPFDRGAITSLIGAMDDTVDEMHAASQAIELYEVSSFDPQMKEAALVALEASKLIAEALPLLRDVSRNGHRLHDLTAKIVQLEGQVDGLFDTGMRATFQAQKANPDPMAFMVKREIYKHLERIADAFEDVANEIDSLVVDHA